jgi:hypothetical protein
MLEVSEYQVGWLGENATAVAVASKHAPSMQCGSVLPFLGAFAECSRSKQVQCKKVLFC